MSAEPDGAFAPGLVIEQNPMIRLRDLYCRWVLLLAAQIAGFAVAADVARRSGRFLWNNVPLFRYGVTKTIAEALGTTHSPEQIEVIARTHAETFRLSLLETEFVHRKLNASNWRKHVRFVGFEPVFKRVRSGRGVMAPATYLGCHQVGMTALGWCLHGRVAAIVSPFQYSTQQRWMAWVARRRLAALYPAGDAISRSLQALRQGRLLVMISEHVRTGSTAIHANFLGKEQGFHPTAAMLAWRSRCPIAVIACRRLDEPYRFELRVYDWIEPPASGRKDWIHDTTFRVVRVLDAIVREHPDQFTWLRQHLLAGRLARRDEQPSRSGAIRP